MAPLDDAVIPKGSLILVTGACGVVGSNIADRFLHYGYKVRATTRTPEKYAWLVELFEEKYGKGKFELVAVKDITTEGAYDEVTKGAAAMVHTTSVVDFQDSNPHHTIPPSIACAVNALKAAYTNPDIKRFTFLSSISAAMVVGYDTEEGIVTQESWGEGWVKMAWADPPYGPERGPINYSASKTLAEQEVWKYHRENQKKRPDLVVNTVLPGMNYGKPFDVAHQGFPSSLALPVALFTGKGELIVGDKGLAAPQYYIDPQDSGRLIVAATLFPNVKDERVFGTAHQYNLDSILDIFRKHYPDRSFPETLAGGKSPKTIQQRDRAEQLLRDLGEPGWVPLETSILANVADLP